MKLLGSAILIASLSAQSQSTDDDQNSLAFLPDARRLRDRQNMIDWLLPPKANGPGRSVQDIKFYGCWCLPDANKNPKQGEPVDALDAACKRANQCYFCASKDNANRDKECTSSGVGYAFTLLGEPDSFDGRTIVCDDDPTKDAVTQKEANKGKDRQTSKYACRRQVCECDKRLAEDLLAVWDQYNVNHIHKNKENAKNFPDATFQLDDGNCDVKKSEMPLPKGELQCCGPEYGVRMPYWDQFGLKACCGNQSYNTLMQACCDGLVVGGNTC